MANKDIKSKVNTTLKEQLEQKDKRKQLWDLTMSNVQKIGNKLLVYAPVELLFVDERFQRVDEASRRKINTLARKWDNNFCDPLRGSLHAEDMCISIIDGYHRLSAAIMNKEPGLVVELLQGLPKNPEERLIAEATYFADQGIDVDPLTPIEKHKANLLRDIPENVIVQKIVDKYDITLKKGRHGGRVSKGHLAGFTKALTVAKQSEQLLDDTIRVLCEARWNLAASGLGALAIDFVATMIKLHPEHNAAVCEELIKILKPVEPSRYFAEAHTKYPGRTEKERVLLHTEDLICERLNIQRVYHGGKVAGNIKVVA